MLTSPIPSTQPPFHLSVPDRPGPSDPPAAAEPSITLKVRAELVRTAFGDSLYGAPFAIVVAILFGFVMLEAAPARTVWTWMLVTVTCNALRLLTRWLFLRRPVPLSAIPHWSFAFVIISGLTGLSWGIGGWIFFNLGEPSYRLLTVLVLSALTTGAARLLVPILAANLAYFYLSIVPLMAAFMADDDLRRPEVAVLCVFYLGFMTIAARQQLRSLRRSLRLSHENLRLAESLGHAKDNAEQLNRGLSAEIARREVVETELRDASTRAVAASQAKSDFLATMSHEIRTPMNGILGMLRVVRDTPLSPVQREHLETAATSADTLLDLLNDVLDFSKIEAGRLDLESTPFAPATLAKSVADLLHARVRDKGLSFDLYLADDLPGAVLNDATRLRQILLNLLGNAIKFTERGRVALALSCSERTARRAVLCFTISDTGIGIDSAAQARLFTPFTQGDSSMSRRYGGTGLGLVISIRLAQAMGGTIQLQSTVNVGSTFRLVLPCEIPDLPPDARPALATPFVAPQLGGRVLVVEDDSVNRQVIDLLLKKLGLTATFAPDGESALTLASARAFDLVLMDCQLPGIDGLETTRRLRAAPAGRSLKIVALTANASTHVRTACFAAGMDDFLSKPIRFELLATTLSKWLAPSAASAPPV